MMNEKLETPDGATPANRKRTFIVGGIAAAAALGLVGAGIAFALAPKPDTPAVPNKISQAQASEVGEENSVTSAIKLTVTAEGCDTAATKVKVVVGDKDGTEAIAETEVSANEQTEIGELAAGVYELHVTAAPVAEDGSTYKLPDNPSEFSVSDEGTAVEVAVTLEKLAKEDMSKEQLEAAAETLAASGKSEAAASVKSASVDAPSVPGSAQSVQRRAPVKPAPSTGGSGSGGGSSSGSTGGSTGGSGSGSKAPSTPSTPKPTPAPTPTPTPAPTPAPTPDPTPAPDSHPGKTWHEAVYEPRWNPPQTAEVPDYDNPVHYCVCEETGVEFSAADLRTAQQKLENYIDDNEPPGETWHAYSDVKYPTVTVTTVEGYYENVLVKDAGWY